MTRRRQSDGRNSRRPNSSSSMRCRSGSSRCARRFTKSPAAAAAISISARVSLKLLLVCLGEKARFERVARELAHFVFGEIERQEVFDDVAAEVGGIVGVDRRDDPTAQQLS